MQNIYNLKYLLRCRDWCVLIVGRITEIIIHFSCSKKSSSRFFSNYAKNSLLRPFRKWNIEPVSTVGFIALTLSTSKNSNERTFSTETSKSITWKKNETQRETRVSHLIKAVSKLIFFCVDNRINCMTVSFQTINFILTKHI